MPTRVDRAAHTMPHAADRFENPCEQHGKSTYPLITDSNRSNDRPVENSPVARGSKSPVDNRLPGAGPGIRSSVIPATPGGPGWKLAGWADSATRARY